jgi:ribose transport system substrate-binding protein
MLSARSFVVLGLAVLLLLPGCGAPSDAPQDNAASDATAKPRVALVMKSLANEFFKTMENGAEAHNKANAESYALIAQGIKDELDVNRQIQLVEQMIAQQVDALVIAPADSKALVAVCKKAVDAGIAVVNIDNKLDADVLADKGVVIPFVGPDNRAGAKLAGDFLAKQLHANDQVVIIGGVPGAFNAIQRRLGFEDAMKAAGMTMLKAQSGDWETDKANRVASSVVMANPELKAILCANDSMALGVVAALKGAGKLGAIKVIGFDNISAAKKLIADGAMVATVDQHADKLAVYGIEYALEIVSKGTAPKDRQTPVDLVTAETLKAQ